MNRPVIVLDLGIDAARDLAAGGAFVTDGGLQLGQECDLVVCGANRRAVFPARVVYVDARGTGLELVGFSSETRALIDELEPLALPVDAREPEGDVPDVRDPPDVPDVPAVIDEPFDRARHDAADAADARLAAASRDNLAEPSALVDLQPIDDDLAIPVAEYDRQTYAATEDDPSDDVIYAEGTDSFLANRPGAPSNARNTDTFDTLDPDRVRDDADEPEDPSAVRRALNVHERMRGLNLAAQIKMAATGEMHERIVLERLYGKNVWETLLRNPRLTAPEVSRIARYGSLPRVLLELIVGNSTWLQVPEVRRALLANPRLATDQIMKILRLTPKHELKLAAIQTAYPQAVRAAAKLLLRA